jgi:dextranase
VLLDVQPDRACYRPGETVRLLISLDGPATVEAGPELHIVGSIAFLADDVARLTHTVQLANQSAATAELAWTPPPVAPRGYGVDLQLQDGSGRVLAAASTAFDVLERWTQAPRYGFLADFSPERTDLDQAMSWLARYHVNGLQFYDWMYRHDQLLPPDDIFHDPLGRRLSLATVRKLIDAAHAQGIAAMPYTAVYGASPPFFQQHPDWALYDAAGKPIPFAEGFLMIMNPTPGSPWCEHLLGQFDEVLEGTAFDGIHLDQYGDPKVAYDASGNQVDLAQVLPQLIDLAKGRATLARPGAAVVLNCVRNWPIESVARSKQDFVYIEVWPPQTRYSDLHALIVEAQAQGGGKPVVLAAYIDPARARNARLADAVILASGGYHIELGEPGRMLADPYFPDYRPMGDGLAGVIRRYYDFAVRYENVLALDTRDATPAFQGKVIVEGFSTGASRTDTQAGRTTGTRVWPIVREREGTIGLSLINLLGLHSPEWDGQLEADPPLQRDLLLRLYTAVPVRRVWWATPDGDSPAGQVLDFSTGRDRTGTYATVRVPRLAYWDLIVLELDDGRQDRA